MDLGPTIRMLKLDLERVEDAIATLEALQKANSGTKPKRGRKSMESAERQQVSERMKKYWDGRRKALATMKGKAVNGTNPRTASM